RAVWCKKLKNGEEMACPRRARRGLRRRGHRRRRRQGVLVRRRGGGAGGSELPAEGGQLLVERRNLLSPRVA
ncbi:hypothetical protein E2562_019517, partial [Oryza meyeriana var. granulata]